MVDTSVFWVFFFFPFVYFSGTALSLLLLDRLDSVACLNHPFSLPTPYLVSNFSMKLPSSVLGLVF
jgi:hypothetical protein